MKNTPIYKMILAAMIIGGFSISAIADDEINAGGFSDSKLTNIAPVKEKKGECVSFEASFSESLDKAPSAKLDIERHFNNMWNSFLQVTKISDKKYRMALTASTAEGCPVIEDESRLTVFTYGGREKANALQIVPEQVTFTADKNAQLKKEKK